MPGPTSIPSPAPHKHYRNETYSPANVEAGHQIRVGVIPDGVFRDALKVDREPKRDPRGSCECTGLRDDETILLSIVRTSSA